MFRRLALVLALPLLLAPGVAGAAGRVLTAQDGSVFVSSARVVRAQASSSTTEWLSLGFGGGPGRLVVVLPVAFGTRVDPSLDAFLVALDGVTAPRIKPPKPVLQCGATHEGSLENTSAGLASSVEPTAVAVLDDLAAVGTYAIAQGVAFDGDDAALLGQTAAARYVAVVYDLTEDAGHSRPLRVHQPGGVGSPSIALLASDAAPDVTLLTIAEGRAGWAAPMVETSASDLGVEWQVLSGSSSYLADRRSELLAKQGGLAVIEASGSTPLFGWTVLPSGAGALAPGVKTYFEKAKKEAAGISSVDFCVTPVWDAIAAGKTGARLSRACAAGALVAVPDAPGAPACDGQPGPGEIAASALVCGSADDLAFAFSGMRADLVRVTRHATIAGANSALASPISVGEGPAVSLLVTADSQNTTGCGSGSGGASGGTTGGAGYVGAGGGNGGYGASTGYFEPAPPDPPVDVNCGVEIVDSCGSGGGSGTDDDESCSGDSSSDDQGDTCGGDASSAEDGDTCGGDSAGDGDTCSGDSSAGAEGDTCSGGDSGGGESCSSGSSSSSGDCSLPRRPRRVRVSAWFLLFAAIALPLRRRARARQASR